MRDASLGKATDEALVARAQGGSTEAFDQLVRRHQSAVRNFLRRITHEPSFGDDVAQEAFFKAWRNLRQFRAGGTGGGSFKGWLFSIAYNQAKDARRSYARATIRDTAWTDHMRGDSNLAPEMEARLDLDRVLTALSPEQRTVVALCFGAGLSHLEAAQALGMPLGTVKSHANRGRDRVLSLLADKKEDAKDKSDTIRSAL